jgi:hypothetical protein
MREQAVQLVMIAQRKADELFEELIAALKEAPASSDVAEISEALSPATSVPTNALQPGSLDGPQLEGDWQETGRRSGETYDWPDGNHDEYEDFVSYRGTGDFADMSLALGYLAYGDVVGFVLAAGTKRGITWFYRADDFDRTKEKVSLIRGNGSTGRAGFAPHEALPNAYRGFEVDVLSKRKAGKWNRLGVVAKEDDFSAMLGHTALQAKLRGLV